MNILTLSDDQLKEEHERIHQEWPKTDYPNPEHTKTELIYLHSQIHEEMKKRNLRHEYKDSLDDTAVKPGVSRIEAEYPTPYATISPTGQKSGRLIKAEEIFPFVKPFKVFSPFAYLHGGTAREGTEHDIDFLVRGYEDDEAARRVSFRLRRMLPEELRKRVHVVFDPIGPAVDNIPLYDLVAVPRKPERIYMASPDFEATEREGIVRLFRAVWPLKGKSGAQETNLYDPKRIHEFFSTSDYPLLVEKKYDGARLQIHCSKGTVKIFTDGGLDVTHRFPKAIAEVKDFADETILDSETEGWIQGKHIGREEMAGYINRNDTPDDSFVVFNIFDIIYKGSDIHNLPLSERKKILKSLSFKQSTAEIPNPEKSHFNLVPSYESKDPISVESAIRLVSQFPASEGAIIKSIHTTYELDGKTTKWVKYKTLFEVSAIVLGKVPVRDAPNTFRLEIGILPFKLAKTKDEYIRKYGEHIYMYVGKTFNTNLPVNPGDIVSIYVETVFKYIDNRTGEERLTLYGPEVLGKREDLTVPATANEVYIAAREAKRLVIKDEATNQTIREISKESKLLQSFSNFCEQHNLDVTKMLGFVLTFDDFQTMAKHFDELMEDFEDLDPEKTMQLLLRYYSNQKLLQGTRLPITDEMKEFVFGTHWRGKSVHIDFRIKWDETTLFGFTLDSQRAGIVTTPVLTVQDARKWQSDPNLFKINNQPGFGAELQPPKILIEFKQAEPVEWFDYTGSVPPGRVGATRHNWGVFDILDTGPIEILAQKPWYIEFFLHGKKYDGYWVIRQMPNIWKMKPSDPERAGPREVQDFIWLIWKAKDQETPYVLSQRAIKQKWIPNKGDSALPRHLRERLPSEYKYWEADDLDQRLAIRDKLVDAMRAGRVKLLEQPSFVLHRRWYKGQTVIRRGPSQIVYDLRINDGKAVRHWVLDFNPITSSEVSATTGSSIDPRWFDTGRGVAEELRPGTELNPSKNTKGWTRIFDEGRIELSDGNIRFFGQFLKGLWKIEGTSGGIIHLRRISD